MGALLKKPRKHYPLRFAVVSLSLFVCILGEMVAMGNEDVDSANERLASQEKLIEEALGKAYEFRVSGKLKESAKDWERAVKLEPGGRYRHPAYSEFWAYLFVKLGNPKKALEVFKKGYVGAPPNPDDLTSEERVAWGERLIFGQPGGIHVPGAIGKAACPLCHEFGEVDPEQRLRAPIISGISTRVKKLLTSTGYNHRGKTIQPYAFEGSGIATNLVEYLAESKVCPSCYVSPGFGVRGTADLESLEPKVHLQPFFLSVDEMILVDCWILQQEGMNLPPVKIIRAAYHKFLKEGKEHAFSSPDALVLAHFHDIYGDEKTALKLLQMHYDGVIQFEEERDPRNRRLGRIRENPEMFPNLRKRLDLVNKFPNLFQKPDWQVTDVFVEELELDNEIFPYHEFAQYPRWFPDGKRILYTVCVPDKPCEIWSKETYNPWHERLLADASFGDPSPDGTRLVFIRDKKIYLNNLHTLETTMLTEVLPKALSPPVWAPDGDAIEVMTAVDSLSSCQVAKFTLKSRSWTSRMVSAWETVRKWQGVPENGTAHFVGLENFWGKCRVDPPSKKEVITTGWERWYDGKWRGNSSLARYLITPNVREEWNPLWLVDKSGMGAFQIDHSGVFPVLSPKGRTFAYEDLTKHKGIPSRQGIVIGSFKKRTKPLPKYFIELGKGNRLEPGMQLLVYYGNSMNFSKEKNPFEEDMAIGGVRVLEVRNKHAVVQQSIFKREVYRANKGFRNNLMQPGDLAVTFDFKLRAPLKSQD